MEILVGQKDTFSRKGSSCLCNMQPLFILLGCPTLALNPILSSLFYNTPCFAPTSDTIHCCLL